MYLLFVSCQMWCQLWVRKYGQCHLQDMKMNKGGISLTARGMFQLNVTIENKRAPLYISRIYLMTKSGITKQVINPGWQSSPSYIGTVTLKRKQIKFGDRSSSVWHRITLRWVYWHLYLRSDQHMNSKLPLIGKASLTLARRDVNDALQSHLHIYLDIQRRYIYYLEMFY